MTDRMQQPADASEDTGFECPECHHTAYFTADRVVLSGRVGIGPDGWDWTEGGSSRWTNPMARDSGSVSPRSPPRARSPA